MAKAINDLTGREFGRLTVIEQAGKNNGRIMWRCRCQCGNEKIVPGNDLTKGRIQSCGCLKEPRDLTGREFGRLTVIEQAEKNNGRIMWRCRCQCGNEKIAPGSDLQRGRIKSCGCLKEPRDLTGQKFGRLVVIERAENDNGRIMWRCRCQCGNEKNAPAHDLTRGRIQSCGCLREFHGMTNERLYREWIDIKKRCNKPYSKPFKYYGARGIAICDEWANSFKAFSAWALANGYRDELTIDRIDVNGPYSPDNCRWATKKEQGNNKRNNHMLTYGGKTQTLTQWADEVNISRTALRHRISSGWSVEQALTTPARKRK